MKLCPLEQIGGLFSNFAPIDGERKSPAIDLVQASTNKYDLRATRLPKVFHFVNKAAIIENNKL